MNFIVLFFAFLFFFAIGGTFTIYFQNQTARILLWLFWILCFNFFVYMFLESLVSLDTLLLHKPRLGDLLIISSTLILCVIGLVSLKSHQRFPRFWILYPYTCFFVVILVSSLFSLFDEVPRGKMSFVEEDEIYLYRSIVAFSMLSSFGGLVALYAHKRRLCALAFAMVLVAGFIHFITFVR